MVCLYKITIEKVLQSIAIFKKNVCCSYNTDKITEIEITANLDFLITYCSTGVRIIRN